MSSPDHIASIYSAEDKRRLSRKTFGKCWEAFSGSADTAIY